MVEIRHATPEDAGGIEEVEASATAVLRRTYRPNAKALANKSRISQKLERLVALRDGRVVGTTQYHIEESVVRIVGLGVLESHRQDGVARALVEFLLELAVSQGLRGVAARTIKETGNVPIFEKLGFHVVSDVKDEYSESDVYPELRDVDLFHSVEVPMESRPMTYGQFYAAWAMTLLLPISLSLVFPALGVVVGILIPLAWMKWMPCTCRSGGFIAFPMAAFQVSACLGWMIVGFRMLFDR